MSCGKELADVADWSARPKHVTSMPRDCLVTSLFPIPEFVTI